MRPSCMSGFFGHTGPWGGASGGWSIRPHHVARPEWVRQARPAAELDGDELIGQGRAPVTVLRQRLSELAPGELLLFRVSFKPEPLIRTLEHQGYGLYLEPASGGGWQVWVREAGGRS